MPDEPPKPAPAAGWYDDPDVDGWKRYWDGSKWTDRRQPPDRPDEPPKPEPADGKGSLRRWYSSLSRGVRWLVAVVVGAGAVAGAISAILALLPGPGPPLSANLSQVSVGPTQMTLDEWAEREAAGTVSVPSGGTVSRFAAEILVQAGDETTSPGGPSAPNGPQPGPVVQPTPLSAEERKTLKDGLELALQDPNAPDLGNTCENDVTSPDCGLRSTAATYLLKAHSPPTVESVKDQFLTLFSDMRTPPAVGQPVGAQVNVNVSATGVSGHTVDIRWTLNRAKGSDPVPEDWARGQTVLTVPGDAPETISKPFWVPIPREEGPYFVRIDVVDEDDNHLDYANGEPEFGSGGAPVSEEQVDGIPFAPFTAASAFTVDAPNWKPTANEESQAGGSLTVLVSPDEDMMVQILQAPEGSASAVAQDAQNERVDEGATDITLKPTTITGSEAYLLRFIHDEESNQPYLPQIGEVYGSTYFFNDSGFTWRVRAAVKTTVPDGKKLALDLARKMAETFEPKP